MTMLRGLLPTLVARYEMQQKLDNENKIIKDLQNNPLEQQFAPLHNENPANAKDQIKIHNAKALEYNKEIEGYNNIIHTSLGLNKPTASDELNWNLINILDELVKQETAKYPGIPVNTAFLKAIEGLPKSYINTFRFQSQHERGAYHWGPENMSMPLRFALNLFFTVWILVTAPFTKKDPHESLGDKLKHLWGLNYYNLFKEIATDLPNISNSLPTKPKLKGKEAANPEKVTSNHDNPFSTTPIDKKDADPFKESHTPKKKK
ncbi:MAG: hypothetical protein A3F18_06345 [Legionellales bacterium RIFCSPHIGHO2_12_FULL_37_14]|nr:MAG: hypothetical protein A3F18_06345 [Legionellales bacterium RIFCSPHIGHO2_12_FULL_37_14]